MIRAGLRRILVILTVVVGGTAAISAALGAVAGTGIDHALAVGFYIAGALVLFGSLALGSRGPMRRDRTTELDQTGAAVGMFPLGILFGGVAGRSFGRRGLRKATAEERSEARWTSFGLFVFGILLVFVGAIFDPSRRLF